MLLHSVDCTLHQDVALSADSLSFMMEQECTTYSCRDYLNGDDDSRDDGSTTIIYNRDHCKNKITPADRMKIVDWCYDIVDQCQFERETVEIAMNIVDRFVSTNRASPSSQVDALHDRAQYQLVTLTALYISIKLNERVSFGSKDFAAASRGTYSVEEIEDMEMNILHGLSWRLCPPTSLQVGNQILSLMLPQVEKTTLEQGTWDLIRDEVAFQTENAVRDYYFTTQRPSTIATAAIINAIEQVNDQDYEYLMIALLGVLKDFAFDSYPVLLEARDQLNCLVNEKDESGVVMVSVTTGVPTLEASHNSSDIYNHHSMVQDKLEETMVSNSSPRSYSVVSTDSCDDSCATVYY